MSDDSVSIFSDGSIDESSGLSNMDYSSDASLSGGESLGYSEGLASSSESIGGSVSDVSVSDTSTGDSASGDGTTSDASVSDTSTSA